MPPDVTAVFRASFASLMSVLMGDPRNIRTGNPNICKLSISERRKLLDCRAVTPPGLEGADNEPEHGLILSPTALLAAVGNLRKRKYEVMCSAQYILLQCS